MFLGRLFFCRSLFFSGVVMFWGRFFLAVHYFERGVLGYEFFLPIGQEAKAKTVIISSLAVTAGQFLVFIYKILMIIISFVSLFAC